MQWTKSPTHGMFPSHMHERCKTLCSRHGKDVQRMWKLHRRHCWCAPRQIPWLSSVSILVRVKARRLRRECSSRATPIKHHLNIALDLDKLFNFVYPSLLRLEAWITHVERTVFPNCYLGRDGLVREKICILIILNYCCWNFMNSEWEICFDHVLSLFVSVGKLTWCLYSHWNQLGYYNLQ